MWRRSNPARQCAQPASLLSCGQLLSRMYPMQRSMASFLQSPRFVTVPGVTCHWCHWTLGVTVAALWQKAMHLKELPRQPQMHNNSCLILFIEEKGVSSPGRLFPSSCFGLSNRYLVDSQGSYLKLSLGNINQERRCLVLCETGTASGH